MRRRHEIDPNHRQKKLILGTIGFGSLFIGILFIILSIVLLFMGEPLGGIFLLILALAIIAFSLFWLFFVYFGSIARYTVEEVVPAVTDTVKYVGKEISGMNNKKIADDVTYVVCPRCNETVNSQNKKCPRCKTRL